MIGAAAGGAGITAATAIGMTGGGVTGITIAIGMIAIRTDARLSRNARRDGDDLPGGCQGQAGVTRPLHHELVKVGIVVVRAYWGLPTACLI